MVGTSEISGMKSEREEGFVLIWLTVLIPSCLFIGLMFVQVVQYYTMKLELQNKAIAIAYAGGGSSSYFRNISMTPPTDDTPSSTPSGDPDAGAMTSESLNQMAMTAYGLGFGSPQPIHNATQSIPGGDIAFFHDDSTLGDHSVWVNVRESPGILDQYINPLVPKVVSAHAAVARKPTQIQLYTDISRSLIGNRDMNLILNRFGFESIPPLVGSAAPISSFALQLKVKADGTIDYPPGVNGDSTPPDEMKSILQRLLFGSLNQIANVWRPWLQSTAIAPPIPCLTTPPGYSCTTGLETECGGGAMDSNHLAAFSTMAARQLFQYKIAAESMLSVVSTLFRHVSLSLFGGKAMPWFVDIVNSMTTPLDPSDPRVFDVAVNDGVYPVFSWDEREIQIDGFNTAAFPPKIDAHLVRTPSIEAPRTILDGLEMYPNQLYQWYLSATGMHKVYKYADVYDCSGNLVVPKGTFADVTTPVFPVIPGYSFPTDAFVHYLGLNPITTRIFPMTPDPPFFATGPAHSIDAATIAPPHQVGEISPAVRYIREFNSTTGPPAGAVLTSANCANGGPLRCVRPGLPQVSTCAQEKVWRSPDGDLFCMSNFFGLAPHCGAWPTTPSASVPTSTVSPSINLPPVPYMGGVCGGEWRFGTEPAPIVEKFYPGWAIRHMETITGGTETQNVFRKMNNQAAPYDGLLGQVAILVTDGLPSKVDPFGNPMMECGGSECPAPDAETSFQWQMSVIQQQAQNFYDRGGILYTWYISSVSITPGSIEEDHFNQFRSIVDDPVHRRFFLRTNVSSSTSTGMVAPDALSFVNELVGISAMLSQYVLKQ